MIIVVFYFKEWSSRSLKLFKQLHKYDSDIYKHWWNIIGPFHAKTNIRYRNEKNICLNIFKSLYFLNKMEVNWLIYHFNYQLLDWKWFLKLKRFLITFMQFNIWQNTIMNILIKSFPRKWFIVHEFICINTPRALVLNPEKSESWILDLL